MIFRHKISRSLRLSLARLPERVAMTGKQIDKERSEIDEKLSGLGNFKAEYFEAADDGLNNLRYQKTCTTKVDLRYVIRNRVVPEVIPDVSIERMY